MTVSTVMLVLTVETVKNRKTYSIFFATTTYMTITIYVDMLRSFN